MLHNLPSNTLVERHSDVVMLEAGPLNIALAAKMYVQKNNITLTRNWGSNGPQYDIALCIHDLKCIWELWYFLFCCKISSKLFPSRVSEFSSEELQRST